ncbi:hypothetical protein C457_11206 [Haloferax prahovense DSM 18310]|uniref:Uncharacterized protein n=1 Tax=Haloferax prahovense (strain DSM 18310 / JCM 13924 / TL6) TaxID=1227461 RepID=M0GAL1_HALPT|nr:DUF6339 family protein [Haloferax prahovense]ELZ68568.1 hypothetical protein C457_11206 [Haloferax prahovense DSM 18310]
MTQTTLTRLKADAKRLLDDEAFLRGDKEFFEDERLGRYSQTTNFSADIDALEGRLRDIVDEYPQFEGGMDSEAAVAVHEEIDLSRSEASDSGIWNDLAMRHFPWFVRHRWRYESQTGMKKKFWTYGSALDSASSTFERLWWIAEMTHEDGDYENTKKAFESRRFCFRVFDIQLGRYKPAALACLEVLYDEGKESFAANDVIDETIQRLRRAGTTIPFEGRTKSELVDIVQSIREDVESG